MMTSITLSGKEYPVYFGFRSMLAYKELTGVDITKSTGEMMESLAMFYCAIFPKTKEMTFEQFVDLLDEPENRGKLNEYLAAQTEDVEKKNDEEDD